MTVYPQNTTMQAIVVI